MRRSIVSAAVGMRAVLSLSTGLAVLWPALAGAGTGLRSEDQVLYTASLSHHWATREWDAGSRLRDIGCRDTYQSFSHYLEYGYSYYYTWFGRAGFAQSECGAESKSGFADLELGVRGRVNRYMNTRSWELVAIIPTSGGQTTGRSRIGCGAFGLEANLNRKDELLPYLDLGYGSSLRLWEGPLTHQLSGDVDLGGPLVRRPWSWSAGVEHRVPLSDGPSTGDTAALDCGTDSQVVRARAGLKYSATFHVDLGCTYSAAVWGEDTSRSRGIYCGYTYTWR